MTLFHGSNKLIEKELIPAVSFHYKPYVYATSDYFYALVRCGKFEVEKLLFREDYSKESFTLVELSENAINSAFNTDGYIYIVDEADFTTGDEFMDNEYVSSHPCIIKRIIYIPNVKDEILRNIEHYNIIRYEDSEKYWENVRGGREGYLKRRENRLKMLKNADKISV